MERDQAALPYSVAIIVFGHHDGAGRKDAGQIRPGSVATLAEFSAGSVSSLQAGAVITGWSLGLEFCGSGIGSRLRSATPCGQMFPPPGRA